MPIRVLHALNDLGPGGTGRGISDLLTRLDRKQFASSVFTLYGKQNLSFNPHYFEDQIKMMGISIINAQQSPTLLGRLRGFVSYIRAVKYFRPHIVHSRQPSVTLIARLARPFCPSYQLVSSVHSSYTPTQFMVERLTAGRDDAIMLVSQQLVEPMTRRAGISTNRLMVVENGVDFEQFAHNSQPDLRQQEFPGIQFLALHISRIHPLKDHVTVLKALQILHGRIPYGFHLHLIGDIYDVGAMGEIERLISEYDLSGYLSHVSSVPDIVAYYHSADVTLVASKGGEGFSRTILESLASGKPAICSKHGNPQRLVEHGITGWVFPTGDAAALAACLEAAWGATPDERAAMGARGKEVAAKYSAQAMAKSYMELYESLVRDGLRPR